MIFTSEIIRIKIVLIAINIFRVYSIRYYGLLIDNKSYLVSRIKVLNSFSTVIVAIVKYY